MSNASPLGKLRIVIIICCLVLVLGILGCSYLNNIGSKILDKDEIVSNVEEYGDDLNYQYVSSYLKKFGIGNINTYKVDEAETKLRRNFYQELPSTQAMAEEIVDLFIEYFYDKIDLTNKDVVTDAVIACLVETTGDKYAYYRTSQQYQDYSNSLESGDEFVGIGIQVQLDTLEISMVFKDSGAAEAGIKANDIVWGVDGKTVEDTESEELINMLKGEEGSTVSVTVKRGEEFLTFNVTRKLLKTRSVYYYEESANIGYIQITQFIGTTVQEFREAVDFFTANGASALVIDVRYNPGGLLSSVASVIDYLVPDAPNRRICSYYQNGHEQVFYTSDNHSVSIPIAVICNEGTASAGELFTAAMRDYDDAGLLDTVIIGANTYGKGIAQSSFILYDGSALTFTIGYFNPPCNVNFHGVGVAPEIEVEEVHTVDAPLEAAKTELIKMVNESVSQSGLTGLAA